ncbi:MAG: type II toxin-antitoxin system RelE/ParE family toxin [Cyclobacteriaceae bacterium]
MRSGFSLKLKRISLEIIEFIAEDQPLAAEKMTEKFESAFIRLSENPLIGRMARDHRLKLLQYRVLLIDPYLIFYQVKKNIVFVFRILHGARDYKNIL